MGSMQRGLSIESGNNGILRLLEFLGLRSQRERDHRLLRS